MNKYYNVRTDEKETIINFDYLERVVNIYTTRVATMKRLLNDIGNPKSIEKIDNKIASMEWDIPFDNRNGIKKVMALKNLMPFR